MTRSTPIRRPKKPAPISKSAARAIWLRAQRLDAAEPFGAGPQATPAAIEHLGYVQIDTIHVIERSHHHILFTRIPSYEHAHLQQAQSVDKSVFEYWTHALSYVPTKDICFFLPAMKRYADSSSNWYKSVTPREVGKVVSRIRRQISASCSILVSRLTGRKWKGMAPKSRPAEPIRAISSPVTALLSALVSPFGATQSPAA